MTILSCSGKCNYALKIAFYRKYMCAPVESEFAIGFGAALVNTMENVFKNKYEKWQISNRGSFRKKMPLFYDFSISQYSIQWAFHKIPK